jgi:hypothetical protein
VKELRSQGMSFDEAFGLADSEYSGDGMSLKPAAEASVGITFWQDNRRAI